MPQHDLKNLKDMLQVLAYPKTQTLIEAFDLIKSSPILKRFQLVAELLYWSLQFYDPSLFYKFCIENERDRINFLNFVVHELYARDNIELNAIHLYRADGSAILELNKVVFVNYTRVINHYTNDQLTPGLESESSHFKSDDSIEDIKNCAVQMTRLMSGLSSKNLTDWNSYLTSCSSHIEYMASACTGAKTQNNSVIDTFQGDIDDLIYTCFDDVNLSQKKRCLRAMEEENLLERIKQAATEITSKLRQLESLRGTQPIFIDEYNEIETELQEYYRLFVINMKTVHFLRKELELHSDARVTNDSMDEGAYLKLDDHELQRGHTPHVTESTTREEDDPTYQIQICHFQKTKPVFNLDKTESIASSSQEGLSSSNISSVSENVTDDDSFVKSDDCSQDGLSDKDKGYLSIDDDF